jgi:hypothetical protein
MTPRVVPGTRVTPAAVPAPAGAVALIALLAGFQDQPKADDAFAAFAKGYLAMGLPVSWEGIDKLPDFKWTSAPTELRTCLPNGDCFGRQGTASIGGRTWTVAATGARTMVINLMLRNTSAPIGEEAVLAALKSAGLTADLARCPIKAGVGGTTWYRLKSGDQSAILTVQPAATGRPAEGFVVTQGDKLPPLSPNTVSLYSEQCGPGAERKAVSTMKPVDALAELMVTLMTQAGGAAPFDWKTLGTTVTLNGDGPRPMNNTARGDNNAVAQTGSVTLGGREFSVLASGTPTQAKSIFLDEGGPGHPQGEHVLGIVYQKGFVVKLVRCGPVYTESTNNWYSVTSAKTKPAMIRQSINYANKPRVTDAYELRLDGTLPARDPRDRDPGVQGC